VNGYIPCGTEFTVPDVVVNVQPHGRILSVLGDIEFSQWQCLAELIDNAFDDFLASGGTGSERPTVSVSLPGRTSDVRSAEVWVADNGRGMDLETLANAVSAGWTKNARYGSLGLYGMGFNIATARLGRVATVRTTRAGDPAWTVITLDLDQLARGRNYDVPVRYEAKNNLQDHGTHVIISKLKTDQWDKLSKQGSKIREELGDVYSYLLRERNFLLTVNTSKVAPRRPCVWDTTRSVTRSGVRIPAIMEIDQPLAPAKACLECGWWNKEWSEECDDCQGADLELRDRRIWGWIGIQRYLHKSDYGIDFLRNGRKILVRDRRLFSWEDPNGINPPELEYPIDSPRQRGRIVGEIHCDHVPVNYQKDAFVYDNPEWRTVVRTIRGDSPLGEQIAKRLGLPRNTSPLAQLYSGYRREDQGLNYLVASNDTAVEWARYFREGDSQYQTDDMWYQLANAHDHPVKPEPKGSSGSALAQMGLGSKAPKSSTDSGTVQPTVPPPAGTQPGTRPSASPGQISPGQTLDQRLTHYRDAATPIVELAGRYDATGLGSVELSAWAVNRRSLVDPQGNDVPSFPQMVRAPKLEVFVAIEHSLFTEYGAELRDMVMMEMAEWMRVRFTPAGRDPKPLAAVLYDIKSRVTDQRMTRDVLATRASRLLDRIREAMQREVKGSPSGYWELLQESERVATQRRFAVEGGGDAWDSVVESGDFTLYLPASAIVRLIEQRPDAFLDNKVFRRAYVGLTDDGSRSLVVSRLIGFIGDLALMEEHHPKLGLSELHRARLSCDLVAEELADQG
jgi:hypothetical protein